VGGGGGRGGEGVEEQILEWEGTVETFGLKNVHN
jgi:hypothetical protein